MRLINEVLLVNIGDSAFPRHQWLIKNISQNYTRTKRKLLQ